MRTLILLLALLACASAFFGPAVKPASRALNMAKPTQYIPDGLTLEQWTAIDAAKKAKVEAKNKKFAAKAAKGIETLDEFQKEYETGAKPHRFAKTKY